MRNDRPWAGLLRAVAAFALAGAWALACANEPPDIGAGPTDSGPRDGAASASADGDLVAEDAEAETDAAGGVDADANADADVGTEADADAASDAAADVDAGADADAGEGGDAALGPCSKDGECVQGAFCDLDAGQCTPTLTNGSSCDRAFQCTSRVCSDDTCVGCTSGAQCGPAASVCDGTTQLCESCRDQGDPGTACSSAGWGNTCVVGTDRCACGSSVQCTNARAPYCMAVSLNIFECECNFAGPCPVGTACVGSFPGACRAISTFPCEAPGDCVSNGCTNGTCD